MKFMMNLTNALDTNIDMIEKISPFAARNDEEIKRFVEERPCGLMIQPIDIEIVKLISKYLILSSRMIGTLLPEYDTDTIKYHIQKLTRANFIYKSEFCNKDGGRSAAKFYALSIRGRGLLFNLGGEFVRMTQYISNLSALEAKKLLSAIQYAVNRRADIASDHFDTQSAPIVLVNPKEGERATLMFRPQAMICKDGKAVEFVESVRRISDMNEFFAKLDRMIATLSKKDLNIALGEYRTVLVCEDYEHMLTMMDSTNRRKYKSLNFVYTYDLATFTSPGDCLYQYIPKRSSGFFANLASACF